MQYSCGPLTGALKPKYKVISAILGDGFNPEKGIDVFIDLNTFVSALSTSRKFMNSLPFSEDVEVDIVSSLLSTVKHWRDYCRRWENSRIILFVNDFDITPLPEQEHLKSYLVPYVNKFQHDRFKQLTYYWNESIKRVCIVLNYIPNTYCIRCNRFDSYIIPNILDDYDKNGRHRLIVTGNPFMTNYTYMKNTHVIYSRYKHMGMCQLSDPLMIVQSITKIDEDIMGTFIQNKVFYNMLSAIVGDFDRGIMGLTQMGISRFATDLLRSVEKHQIPNKPLSIETVLPAVDKSYHDYLVKSYPLIDIEKHSMLIPQSQIEKVKSDMVDLYDIDGLRSLSIKGLNLIELL